MNIAGIVKSSFIDYPGCASTVIFLGGCNFKCGYCHNPEIVHRRGGEIALPDFFAFLERRKKFLDAVCVSGGEPGIHPELYDLIVGIRERGYQVKLDTNGTNPKLLGRLLGEGLVNHVAMDIKGPWEKYSQIAGLNKIGHVNGTAESAVRSVQKSLSILMAASGADKDFTYELRTTVCRELLDRRDIVCMAEQLAGAELWYLQTFRKQDELLDAEGSYSAYTPSGMEELRDAAQSEGTIEAVRIR